MEGKNNFVLMVIVAIVAIVGIIVIVINQTSVQQPAFSALDRNHIGYGSSGTEQCTEIQSNCYGQVRRGAQWGEWCDDGEGNFCWQPANLKKVYPN